LQCRARRKKRQCPGLIDAQLRAIVFDVEIESMPHVELRTKKNTLLHRFFLTLILPKTIPSLAGNNSLQRIRLITGRTGKMATKKAAKKVAKKAAKKK